MSGNQHVLPNGEGWSVRRTGASRASRVYKTQNEAIRAARGIAANQGTEVYIHERDGRIRAKETPQAPKNK